MKTNSFCFFCGEKELLLDDNTYAFKAISSCFRSEEFHLLLHELSLCIVCMGRVQHLETFCLAYQNHKQKPEPCDTCHFCGQDEAEKLIPPKFNPDLAAIVKLTIFTENVPDDLSGVRMCYACYNHIQMFSKMKTALSKKMERFRIRSSNCTVVVVYLTDEQIRVKSEKLNDGDVVVETTQDINDNMVPKPAETKLKSLRARKSDGNYGPKQKKSKRSSTSKPIASRRSASPVLIKNIEGMTTSELAKKYGLKELKVQIEPLPVDNTIKIGELVSEETKKFESEAAEESTVNNLDQQLDVEKSKPGPKAKRVMFNMEVTEHVSSNFASTTRTRTSLLKPEETEIIPELDDALRSDDREVVNGTDAEVEEAELEAEKEPVISTEIEFINQNKVIKFLRAKKKTQKIDDDSGLCTDSSADYSVTCTIGENNIIPPVAFEEEINYDFTSTSFNRIGSFDEFLKDDSIIQVD